MTNHKEHQRTASAENPAQAGEVQYLSEGLFGTGLPVVGTAEDPGALPQTLAWSPAALSPAIDALLLTISSVYLANPSQGTSKHCPVNSTCPRSPAPPKPLLLLAYRFLKCFTNYM